MRNKTNRIACAGMLLTFGFNAMGDTIYNTAATYNGNLFTMTNGQELGTEIVLTGDWALTNISVEYYAPGALASTIGLEVRLYANDGAGTAASGFYPTPGTLIFDSGFFYGLPYTLLPGGAAFNINYNTVDFLAGGFSSPHILPSDFTLTVTYTNTASADLNGLQSPLANSPSGQPGSSFGDYWYNNGGNWELLTNTASAANLLVDVSGTPTPEPSVFYLGALGSALIFGARQLKRKR